MKKEEALQRPPPSFPTTATVSHHKRQQTRSFTPGNLLSFSYLSSRLVSFA
jgi:hypothetical protein